MALVFRGWLPTNEQRNYPVHENCSCLADGGTRLPDDILTDAHILVPAAAGRVVLVSSVAVTARLATVTFVAADRYPAGFEAGGVGGTPVLTPLATVHVQRPVKPYVSYNIDALYPGAKGWVTFGTGVEKHDDLNLFFSTFGSALLVDRCVRITRTVPVQLVGKYGLAARLQGLVRLTGSSTVETYKDTREVNGVDTDVAVIALKVPSGDTNTDVMHRYAGSCYKRPAEGTCTAPALKTINGVAPDREGNINIVFTGANEIVGDAGDGLVLDYPLGLTDVCPGKDYAPYDPDDPCEPSTSSEPSSSTPSESSQSDTSSYVPDESSSSYCTSLDSEYGRLEPILGDGIGTWSFEETPEGYHRLTATAGEILPCLITSLDKYEIVADGDELVVVSTIKPTQTPLGEGHVVFGYRTNDNFYFAGLSLRPSSLYPGGRFFIGRKSTAGGGWPNGLGSGYRFLSGASFDPGIALQEVDYRFEARVKRFSATTAEVTIEVSWTDPEHGAQLYMSPPYPVLGINTTSFKVGLGCVSSPKAEFANWCVYGLREKQQ